MYAETGSTHFLIRNSALEAVVVRRLLPSDNYISSEHVWIDEADDIYHTVRLDDLSF
jgi:hypothetical protein